MHSIIVLPGRQPALVTALSAPNTVGRSVSLESLAQKGHRRNSPNKKPLQRSNRYRSERSHFVVTHAIAPAWARSGEGTMTCTGGRSVIQSSRVPGGCTNKLAVKT